MDLNMLKNQKKELSRQIKSDTEQLEAIPNNEANRERKKNIKSGILDKKNQRNNIEIEKNNEQKRQIQQETYDLIKECVEMCQMIKPKIFSSNKALAKALGLSVNYFNTCLYQHLNISDDVINKIIKLLQKFQSEAYTISLNENYLLDYSKTILRIEQLMTKFNRIKLLQNM